MTSHETKKQNEENIKDTIKYLEKEMIDDIIDYAENGNFPKNNSNSAYVNVYSKVLDVADISDSDKKCKELLEYYKSKIKNFIENSSKKIEKITKKEQILDKKINEQLIDEFIKLTNNIFLVIYYMKKIFIYLDRFYTKYVGRQSLSKIALEIYKDTFFINVQDRIYKELNKLIKEDRKYNFEYRTKIIIISKIISYLDFSSPEIIKENQKIVWVENYENSQEYIFSKKWFNSFFEKETISFAKEKAKADINSMSVPEYIKSQLMYLNEEYKREAIFISKKFHKKIDDINYKYLINDVVEDLGKMDTGFSCMFLNKRMDELKNSYQLLCLTSKGLPVIAQAFQSYIKQRGLAISNNKEISKDPKKLIPELIKLQKEMDNIIEDCFDNNNIFKDSKNKSFTILMNKDFYAKQLANYTDYCMRIGFKGKEEEVDTTLNEIIDLFKCINTKLVFQIETNKKMSDRLIKNNTISPNYEKKLISKLKQEQGIQYVSKMTQMMNDLDTNKKEMEDYKMFLQGQEEGAKSEIKFNVQIISQSAWEINNKALEKIEIPKYLGSLLTNFENYYYRKHSGQKLFWCLGLSKIEIQYLCFKNKNISISTLPQYLILLQLEKYKTLSLSKLAELLGCHISTILTDITGLVFHPSYNPQSIKEKGLILGTFDEKEKVFKPNDEITFNHDFSNARQRFQTLPMMVKKNPIEEKETEIEEAQITKRYQDNILQASLTRIMKSRIGQKTTHVWLINEVGKQIDLFRAQPTQIKENIEKLIEKNIIKRSDNDRTCYEYIA